ncbi:MAG: MMPL family transporter [Candidatus Binatia bacterium]|nr:MMPL family transporter [Candidatus Binatia bacterium]
MIAARLAAATLRRPAVVASLLLLATLGLTAGILRLTTEVGYRAFLGHGHPTVAEFDGFVERFGGGLPLVAVWTCEDSPCEQALDIASLTMAHDVASSLANADGITRVDSPATSPLVVNEILGLPRARRLAPEGKPARDLERLTRLAREDPLWLGQLISEDGRSGAILLHLESSDSASNRSALAALKGALAPHEDAGFVFHLVGGPVEFVVAGDELERNMARIVPFMVALVGLVLYFAFRSVAAVAASLIATGIAVAWTFGLMGWLGWPQNSLTQALAPLLLVVGVCDAIHLVARILAYDERPVPDAILAASRDVGPPCIMTTVTTAAGFASLATSPLESIARFGILASFGVIAALVLTFTLLPLLVLRVPREWLVAPELAGKWHKSLDALARFSHERPAAILTVAAGAALLSLLGLRSLHVDASFEDLYGEDSQVVRWSETVARVLRQPDTLEIAIEPPTGQSDTLLPGLRATSRIKTSLDGLDGLGRSRSLLDPMRRLNRIAHREELDLSAGDAAQHVASLRRLLRNADRGVIDLLRSPDTGDLRISIEAAKLPQDRLRAVLADVRTRVAQELPAGWSMTITGPLAVVQVMIDEIRTTQLRSFGLAALIIFAVVSGFLRSIRDGALAMVPTLLPILVTLGTMGALGVPLDVGSAMVAAVVLGIAVDDAIHFLGAFRRGRAAGRSSAEAGRLALAETGRAIIGTSVALAIGFLLLLLSPWKSIASFGLVSAVVIATALLAALVVLPALLSYNEGQA